MQGRSIILPAVLAAALAAPAAGQSISPSGGTGMCSDYSGRNFRCGSGGGGGGGGVRVPVEPPARALNRQFHAILKKLVAETPLRWGDIPRIDWSDDIRVLAKQADGVYAGVLNRYYREQAARKNAETELAAMRDRAGYAASVAGRATQNLDKRRAIAEKEEAVASRLGAEERRLGERLRQRKAVLRRVESEADGLRNGFYARLRGLEMLPQSPSAYRAPVVPPAPVYGERPRPAVPISVPRDRPIYVEPARPNVAYAAQAAPRARIKSVAANSGAIAARFRDIEKTAKRIAPETSALARAQRGIDALRGAARNSERQRRDALSRVNAFIAAENRAVAKSRRLRPLVAGLREKIAKEDRELPVAIIEWAAWKEYDRRLQKAVDRMQAVPMIDLSGVNTVRDVMIDAGKLAEDILKVLKETPRALAYEPDAIDRLQGDIDAAVRRFNVSFHANLTGLPGWAAEAISRHTAK